MDCSEQLRDCAVGGAITQDAKSAPACSVWVSKLHFPVHFNTRMRMRPNQHLVLVSHAGKVRIFTPNQLDDTGSPITVFLTL